MITTKGIQHYFQLRPIETLHIIINKYTDHIGFSNTSIRIDLVNILQNKKGIIEGKKAAIKSK